MAGIPILMGGLNGGSAFARISCFLKVNTMLTHDTALVDLDFSPIGNLRLSWQPAGLLAAEVSYGGGSAVLYLFGSTAIMAANAWHWLSASAGSTGNTGESFLRAQVWRPDGTTPGPQIATFGVSRAVTTTPAGLGWGIPLSSGYNPFPFAPGDEMTELVVETGAFSCQAPLAPPAAPFAATDALARDASNAAQACIVALYHCDEPLGQDRTIHDASANHYDLAPGPNHDQILADSPF